MQETSFQPPVSPAPIDENPIQETSSSVSPVVVILGVLVVVLIAGLGYLLYQNRMLSQQVLDLQSEMAVATDVSEPSEVIETNAEDQVPTSLGGLATQPETKWIPGLYGSIENPSWQILEPAGTIAFEGGLTEGYLRLTMPYQNYSIQGELSYPRLGEEPPYPETIDAWITEIFDRMPTDYIDVPKPVTDNLVTLEKTATTEIKMFSTQGAIDGTNQKAPVVYVFRWHEPADSERLVVNMLVFKSFSTQVIPTETLETFAKEFLDGVTWSQ